MKKEISTFVLKVYVGLPTLTMAGATNLCN